MKRSLPISSLRFWLGTIGVAFILGTSFPLSAEAQTNTFPSTGNVGIGTTSPSEQLTISSSSHVGLTIDPAAGSFDGSLIFKRGGMNKWFIQSRNSGAPADAFTIYDAVNTTFRFTIDRSGKVGIGLTSPLYSLDVNGGVNGFRAKAATTSSSDAIAVFENSSGIQAIVRGNGFVGIGTTSPRGLLHVGNGTLSTATNVINLAPSDSTISANQSSIYWGRAADNWNPVSIGQRYSTGMNYGGVLAFSTHADDGVAANLPIERLTILANGNVGIGTTAPAAKLAIGGNGTNVYNTDAWIENNIHVQGNETLGQGGRGRMRIGTAWGYVGLYAETSSSGAANDLLLGSGTGRVRVGPGGSTVQNFIVPNGSVGIGTGTATPSEKLEVVGNITVTGSGNINASGAITGGTIHAKYQDVAEWVESSQALAAGTVVVLDHTRSNQVIASSQAYDTRVAGVISLQPGITLGETGAGKVLVATTGRVKIKVDATAGPIQIGDLLVTSDVPGVAMKSEPIKVGGRLMHMPGTLIGKALEPLEKGSEKILVLLSLQ